MTDAARPARPAVRAPPAPPQAIDYLVGVVPTEVPQSGAAGIGLGPSPFGRPMSAVELKGLYRGRTWLWPGGGGYFEPNGRFSAVAGTDRETGSQVQGRWETTDRGQLCCAGMRRTQAGNERFRTCFMHFVWGESIYHRREPDGRWLPFKRTPVRETDEFSKLVKGNRISDQLRQVRTALGPTR